MREVKGYRIFSIPYCESRNRFDDQEFQEFVSSHQIIVAHFRDRVVFQALCAVIGPILDATLIEDSYACRVGKGMHRALARAQHFVRHNRYFLKLDIRKYFESIEHTRLQVQLQRKIKDQRTLWLIERIIKHVPVRYCQGYGLPIGNLSSQHFANFYLSPFDHLIKQTLKIRAYLRYMDDFLLLGVDKTVLWGAYHEILYFLDEKLGLEINTQATLLAPVTQGVPFLGFRLYPHKTLLQKKNWHRFKRNFIKRQEEYLAGRISLEHMIAAVRSMSDFIDYGDTCRLRRKFIDKYAIDV